MEELKADMENTNEDLDIAFDDLKDFILKNDAQLEEGVTFDLIFEQQAKPYVDRRKLESKTLILKTMRYMEEIDYKMNEMVQNLINLYKEIAKKMDEKKETLKSTEMQFKVSLAQCGDNYDEIVSTKEEELTVLVERMKRAIHHVELNERLQECFDKLDDITKVYREYNNEYIDIVEKHTHRMDEFYNTWEKEVLGNFKIYTEEKRDEI